jgi:fermentation-respiration switch protein FrsA (DUF1100 family)
MAADTIIPPTAARAPVRRRLIWLLLGLAAAYGLSLALLLFLENRLIFLPARQAESWREPGDPRIEDVWLEIVGGRRIHAWWAPVENPHWYLLYAHGNAGNLSHRQAGIRRIQQSLQASVLIFDYPGYGRSEGTPSEDGCYQAARASYRWLRQVKHAAGERIILYGVSLGAAVAVELAATEDHAALVLLSPFLSIPDMAQQMFPIFPARWLCRNRFDNAARLKDYRGPLFIAHGTQDEAIPFAHGKKLYELAPSMNKRFLAVEGADHNHLAGDEFFQVLVEFIRGLSPPA